MNELRDWKRGTPLTARQLQEAVTGVRELRRRILPQEAVATVAASPDDVAAVNEVWDFVAETTLTERIEDADDDTVYIDVTIQTSVTLRKPDGTTVQMKFQADA